IECGYRTNLVLKSVPLA
ncbi:hypothetical protein D018_1351B, partial [Vibrio parahaemolyticus VP2007-007]